MSSELPAIDAGFKAIASIVGQFVFFLFAFRGPLSNTRAIRSRLYVGGLFFNNFLESNKIWQKVGVHKLFMAIAGGEERKLP
jgi:hypothetical protein